MLPESTGYGISNPMLFIHDMIKISLSHYLIMFNSLSRTGKRQNGVQIKYLRGSPITKGEGGGTVNS